MCVRLPRSEVCRRKYQLWKFVMFLTWISGRQPAAQSSVTPCLPTNPSFPTRTTRCWRAGETVVVCRICQLLTVCVYSVYMHHLHAVDLISPGTAAAGLVNILRDRPCVRLACLECTLLAVDDVLGQCRRRLLSLLCSYASGDSVILLRGLSGWGLVVWMSGH